MQSIMAKVVLVAFVLGAAQAAKSRSSGENAVQKVVELLKSVEKKVEEEGKAEEELFNKYECWATKSIDEKKEAIFDGKKRIQVLESRIAGYDRLAASQERDSVFLNKDMKAINVSMAEESAEHFETNKEQYAALNETTEALDGFKKVNTLLSSVGKLKNLTQADGGSLLALRGGHLAKRKHRHLVLDVADKAEAAKVADRYLSVGDAAFVKSLLKRSDPNPAKSTDDSAAISGHANAGEDRLQNVLKLVGTLQEQVEKDHAERLKKVDEIAKDYRASMAAKTRQRSDLEKEHARLLTRVDVRISDKQKAEDELKAVKDDNAEAQNFIDQVEAALKTKTREWEERSGVRQDELTALSKAMSTLYNADMKHVVNRAYATSFLQEVSVSRSAALVKAVRELNKVSHSSGDTRLLALATGLGTIKKGDAFSDEVFEKIEDMIKVLDKEDQTDTEKKEKCEADLAADTKDKSDTQEAIATLTSDMDSLDVDMETIDKDIAEKEKEIKAADEELEAALKNRKAEHQEYLKAKEDDLVTMQTIATALQVIKTFYAEKPTLLQSQSDPPVDSDAPATWSSSYEGSTADGNSIISMIEDAKKDLQSNMDTANTCEENAKKLYEEAEASLENQKKSLNAQIDTQEVEKGEKSEEHTGKATEKATESEELRTIVQRMKDAKPGCDFWVGEYEKRKVNREEERAGLRKAIDILKNYDTASAADDSQ